MIEDSAGRAVAFALAKAHELPHGIPLTFLFGVLLLGVLDRLGAHHGNAARNEKV